MLSLFHFYIRGLQTHKVGQHRGHTVWGEPWWEDIVGVRQFPYSIRLGGWCWRSILFPVDSRTAKNIINLKTDTKRLMKYTDVHRSNNKLNCDNAAVYPSVLIPCLAVMETTSHLVARAGRALGLLWLVPLVRNIQTPDKMRMEQ